jgi:prenyltransferase/squalene oxidase-like repeat protein
MLPRRNRRNPRFVCASTQPVIKWVVACSFFVAVATSLLLAQDTQLSGLRTPSDSAAKPRRGDDTPSNVLSAAEWQRVDAGVERALNFLISQQQPDGSFPTMPHAQPGVTSLCVLGFMAHGHTPGDGTYGERLEQATEFIMACQKENGLITLYGPDGPKITREISHELGTAATYNHAIASLTLCEMYGMGHAKQRAQMQRVINKALEAALEMQRWPKDSPGDKGGWRYVDDFDTNDSDLSVTGWYLMFLRSARNAGFNVPKQAIDDAVGFVRRVFQQNYGAFGYTVGTGRSPSRGTAGAGILALGHAGYHNSFEAQRTGQWLMQYSFEVYNDTLGLDRDRYHYSLFNCCQGMYQLGSPYWEQFFPRTVRTVLAHQQPDGSWDAESYHRDRQFGNSYTTALVLLSLAAPNQLLPIFQR